MQEKAPLQVEVRADDQALAQALEEMEQRATGFQPNTTRGQLSDTIGQATTATVSATQPTVQTTAQLSSTQQEEIALHKASQESLPLSQQGWLSKMLHRRNPKSGKWELLPTHKCGTIRNALLEGTETHQRHLMRKKNEEKKNKNI
ncbi:uncharacterized protein LOC144654795 [Oculina patagonica]